MEAKYLAAIKKGDDAFAAKTWTNHKTLSDNILFYVNPFSKGLIFQQKDIDSFLKQLNVEPENKYYLPCSNLDILKRVLNNLVYSFEKLGYIEKVEELKSLEKNL